MLAVDETDDGTEHTVDGGVTIEDVVWLKCGGFIWEEESVVLWSCRRSLLMIGSFSRS